MPLLYPALYQPLVGLFKTGTPVSALAAQQWAQAYVIYTSTALFGPNVPIFTGAEQAAFQAALLPVFVPVGTAASVAAAIQSAVLAFWSSPPIAVAGPAQAGVVTAVPGAASLGAALTGILSNPLNTAETAAAQIATAIDIATRTAIATVAPPPGTVVPIV